VHNNHYFLRQLSLSLKQHLHESVISECFSQNKDELIIRFETHSGSFFLKASLTPTLSCLSFPTEFHRARKNSIDLFPEMLGHRVMDIIQVQNERSFMIRLAEGKFLLFKMHGNRSNLVLFEKDNVIDLFRKNLDTDLDIVAATSDRMIDWGFETFQKHQSNPASLYFTFGKPVWQYLESNGFRELRPEEQWKKILDVKKELEQPSFFITEIAGKLTLSLLNFGDIKKSFEHPVEAVNEFFHAFTHSQALHQEKNSILGQLRARLTANKSFIKKNATKLHEIETDNTYKVWADLVMANMHAIPANAEKITLENFYNNNQPIQIKLKQDFTPQKECRSFLSESKKSAD
jgi:predicted ribosome quality control (RQC) complex YloA/Tae2 family protein